MVVPLTIVTLSADTVKQDDVPTAVTLCVRVYVPDSTSSPQEEMFPAKRASAFVVCGVKSVRDAKSITRENMNIRFLFVKTFCIFGFIPE